MNNTNMNVTPNTSPVKLAPHHNIFMTNLQKTPISKRATNFDISSDNIPTLKPMSLQPHAPQQSNLNSQNALLSQGTTNTNSNRVIESLHEQIETLTKTNLQLTLQSHDLLNKVEEAQTNQNKLLDTLTLLKSNNETLSSTLEENSRVFKEKERLLTDLKLDYSKTIKDKIELEREYKSYANQENNLNGELEMIQCQYNALVQSQFFYKTHYEKEITKLQDELDRLTLNKEAFLSYDEHKKVNNAGYDDNSGENNSNTLFDKLTEFEELYQSLKEIERQDEKLLNEKYTTIISEMNIETCLDLYKEAKSTIMNFAEKMDIPVSLDEETLKTLHKPQNITPKTTPSPSSPLPLVNPFLPENQQLRVAKLRNTSGASNTNTSNKRRSFYGLANSSTSTHISPGASPALPGVKRTPSSRKTSDSKGPSSPLIEQQRTPNSRTSSAASNRKKRGSMLIH